MRRAIPIVLLTSAAHGQCIPVPTPIDAYSGLDGAVYSSVVFDDGTGPALYLGGSFSLAGMTRAANIVKWDGQEFVALGTGSGRTVRSIAVDGNSLLAEGGGSGAQLRRWQGGAWTNVGPGLAVGSQINVIRVAADGIYIGLRGSPTSGFLVLRNSAWEIVGGGVGGEVCALELTGTRWIVGGNFSHVGGTPGLDVNAIAQWNGTAWSALGAGLDGTVRAISVMNNEIYAGGSFEASDGQAVTCVGRFDGTRWREVGNGLEGPVYHLSQIDGELVAAGAFTRSNTVQLDHVARFVNGGWEPISSGINGDVRTLAQFAGKLYAGGDFTKADGKPALRIAAVHNGQWRGLLSGIDGTVSALTKFQDRLIVSGSFTQVGGVSARRMAAFDGDSWSQFGADGGFSANCFVEFGNQLIAGGAFSVPGGPSGVARFNGSSWDAMGVLEGNVKGMHVHNGELYAYGNGLLRQAGPTSQPYYGLAKWDGTNWVNGFPGVNRSVSVNALETFNGRLYMAGDSTGTLMGVWDLSGAEPVPAAGAANSRYALKTFNGQLYIGGGLPVLTAWTGVSNVLINTVPISGGQTMTEHFEVHAGRLYAIGWFAQQGVAPIATVLRIVDGPTPLAPKSSFPAAYGGPQPTTTAQSFGSRLYVGGSFKFFAATATSTNSSSFLSSLVCQCAGDFNNDSVVDTFDYLDFLQQFSVGNVTADFNTDGVVDFFDYLDLVAAMTEGC